MTFLQPWRAIGIASMHYAVSFLLTLLIGIYTRINFASAGDVSSYLLFWGMFLLLITTPLFTIWYFGTKRVPANAKTGFIFGLMLFAVAFFFDLLFNLPVLFSGHALQEVFLFYFNPLFWVSMLEMFALAALTGEWLRKRRRSEGA